MNLADAAVNLALFKPYECHTDTQSRTLTVAAGFDIDCFRYGALSCRPHSWIST
jgi:hypothetical protein